MSSEYNINAGLVDQRVQGLIETYPDIFSASSDINWKKSAAFVLLSMALCLDMDTLSASEYMTDGGNDAGVDGIYIGDIEDGEFQVIIFQGKYKVKNLSGNWNFPETGVKTAINSLQTLFDPRRSVELNERVKPYIEDVRSLIKDGYIPSVRVVLCNNGSKWNDTADGWIADAYRSYGDKVEFVHFNHDDIIQIMQKGHIIDTRLQLNGQSTVEDMNFMRVMIGRISVSEIHSLFSQHGEKLLQKNIRRYLGLHTNRVNSAIHESLKNPDSAKNFYFYNNGITVICDKFDYNAFEKSDHIVNIKNMQIINGGQTCKTIYETLKESPAAGSSSYVMIRIYQMSERDETFIRDVTYATNSQNPVDLRDLHSNDENQKKLETGIEQLGYKYRRYREEGLAGSGTITSSTVAESVLAIWKNSPHQAKFRRTEHFGKLYDKIFNDLNAAQAVLAVLIFRFVENERRAWTFESNKPNFIPYANHYIAMLIGKKVLNGCNIKYSELTHINFEPAKKNFEDNGRGYYDSSISDLDTSLTKLYGERSISLQQISATFRRSDLLDYLG